MQTSKLNLPMHHLPCGFIPTLHATHHHDMDLVAQEPLCQTVHTSQGQELILVMLLRRQCVMVAASHLWFIHVPMTTIGAGPFRSLKTLKCQTPMTKTMRIRALTLPWDAVTLITTIKGTLPSFHPPTTHNRPVLKMCRPCSIIHKPRLNSLARTENTTARTGGNLPIVRSLPLSPLGGSVDCLLELSLALMDLPPLLLVAIMVPTAQHLLLVTVVVARMETSWNVAGLQVQLRHPLVVARMGQPFPQKPTPIGGNATGDPMRLDVSCPPLVHIHIHIKIHVAAIETSPSIERGHHRVAPFESRKKNHVKRAPAFLHRLLSGVVANCTNSSSSRCTRDSTREMLPEDG